MDIKIESHLDDVMNAVDEATERALEAVALTAERYAKLNCPVDTGRLRNSISHDTDKDTAYIGTNVEYAPYVELGTSKQKAKAYLKPAITEHSEEYKQIIEKYLKG